MKKTFTLAALQLCLYCCAIAQSSTTGSIHGSIMDASHQPLVYANVLLFSESDSTLAKAEYTSDDGTFKVLNIKVGKYWAKVVFLGLPDFSSDIFTVQGGNSTQVPTIIMAESSTELKEVVVTALKPLIEVKPDKTVFNVEGSINATGSNAFELLRKAPGLVVDNNDNIILLGKSGVKIYIDNRPSPLSADDLVQLLKGMQSDQIEAIEIITNPSSKYDAEGNAGIINIRMKKDKRHGNNANVTLGYTIAKHPKYYLSSSFNHRDKKTNVFGSYSHGRGKRENYFNLYRIQGNTIYDQKTIMTNDFINHNFKLGADYLIDDKNTIGVAMDAFVSDRNFFTDGRTELSTASDKIVDSLLLANGTNAAETSNLGYNINYQYDNKEGLVWNFDGNYGQFRRKGSSYQPNIYTSPNGEEIYNERIFASNTPTDINLLSFKVDHERNIFDGKLEAGLKFSRVTTDNTYDFFDVINGDNLIDLERSNNFVYNEDVSAAYFNYQRQFKKLGIHAGLRLEHTNSLGTLTSMQDNSDKVVPRDYLDFFPSGGLTYQVNPKTMWRLNYSRRISRPSYEDLNPFEFKIDELTYQRGNPFLQPQYTQNIQLTNSYNYRYTTTLNYSYTKDFFTEIIDTTESRRSFISKRNLANQQVWSLSFGAPFTISKVWSAYVNINAYQLHNTADFGENQKIDLVVNAFSFYNQHTFMLPKGFSWEVSGFYNSPSVWGGTFKTEAMWGIDTGLKKKILKGKGSIKIAFSDIFNTMRWTGDSNHNGVKITTSGGWESQKLRINFTYLFGNDKVKSRNRKTGMEDEKNRIKAE